MDPSLIALAEQQHGHLNHAQWYAAGATRHQLRNALRQGEVVALSERVVRVAGSPRTRLSGAHAALLDTGERSVLALWTGAAAFDLPGFRLVPYHVWVDRPVRHQPKPTDLAVLHYTRCLPDDHIALVDGLRVTTPVRTVFDLAAHLHPKHLEVVIDRAWARGLLTGRQLERTLRQLQGRGRAGITVMRELIDARGDGYRPNDSNLERRFEEIMHEAGITTLRRQVDLGDDRDWIGRADFRDTEVPLVVLVQSSLHHTSLVDRRKDAEQIAAYRAAGLHVHEVWDRDIWHDRHQVVAGVRAALAEAAKRR